MDKTHDANTLPWNSACASIPSGAVIAALSVMIAGISLTLLALAAHATPYFYFDLTLARTVQSIHAGWFDGLMRVVAWPGYPPQIYVEIVIIFLVLFFDVSRWAAIANIFATVGISVVGMAIKMIVDRPRPSPDLVQVWNANLDGGKFSFPAGHVQVYVTIIGFLLYLAHVSQNRSWTWMGLMIIGGLLIALIGLARVYSGEHWFSDAVGGYLLGSIWLVLTIYFYRWGKSRFFVRVERLAENSAAPTI